MAASRGISLSVRPVLASVAVLALAAAAVGLAAAHADHGTANAQLSPDGTVIVERVILSEPGHLVLHADDDGRPGRVLGHQSLARGSHTGVSVRLDRQFWRSVSGSTTVWATLHADDGDGQFEPGVDRMLLEFDAPAGARFRVGRGERAVVVTNASLRPVDGAVSIRRATVPDDGYVVLHRDANGSLGPRIGHGAVAAGTHRNLRVPVSTPPENRTDVSAVLYADDGDGTFDDGDDPIAVAGRPVASNSSLLPGETSLRVEVVTPSRTPTDSDSGATATPARGVGSGFGAGLVVVAFSLLVSIAVLARRRSR